jgi:hypothetical protein
MPDLLVTLMRARWICDMNFLFLHGLAGRAAKSRSLVAALLGMTVMCAAVAVAGRERLPGAD